MCKGSNLMGQKSVGEVGRDTLAFGWVVPGFRGSSQHLVWRPPDDTDLWGEKEPHAIKRLIKNPEEFLQHRNLWVQTVNLIFRTMSTFCPYQMFHSLPLHSQGCFPIVAAMWFSTLIPTLAHIPSISFGCQDPEGSTPSYCASSLQWLRERLHRILWLGWDSKTHSGAFVSAWNPPQINWADGDHKDRHLDDGPFLGKISCSCQI